MTVTRIYQRAFSLTELLIVVCIMSILVLLAMPNQTDLQQTQLMAAAKVFESDLNALQAIARAGGDPNIVFAIIMPEPEPIVDAFDVHMGEPLACASVSGWLQPTQVMLPLAEALFGLQESSVCCYNRGSCRDNVAESTCTDPDGSYKGVYYSGVDCASNPCEEGGIAGGSCCLPRVSNACVDTTTVEECVELGGIYHDGNECASDPCAGACCYMETDEVHSGFVITCASMAREACEANNGTFHGVDTSCTCTANGCGGSDGSDPCTPLDPPLSDNFPALPQDYGGTPLNDIIYNPPVKNQPLFIIEGGEEVVIDDINDQEKGAYYQVGKLIIDPVSGDKVFETLIDPKTGSDWLVPFTERRGLETVRVKTSSFSSESAPLVIHSTDGRVDRTAAVILATQNLDALLVISPSGAISVQYGASGSLDDEMAQYLP